MDGDYGSYGRYGSYWKRKALSFNDNLYLHDSAIVHLHDFEGETIVGYLLVQIGEVTLYFQEQAGQRVGIALNGIEEFVIEFQNLREVGQ